jgi:hypothetical protein
MRKPSKLGLAIALTCAVSSLGCHRAASEPPEPAADPLACGAGLRFADYDWVPDDAGLATSIQRDDPELAAALTTLARMTEARDITLPVPAALDFRNLSLQLGNLDRVFDELGDDPRELVELHSPAGETVWLWPSDCPPALLAARALLRWQITLRADLEHPGQRLGVGSPDGFPFDVITIATLTEQRVALTRAGHGATVGAWLRESPRGGERGPGRTLAVLDAAPVRAVLSFASTPHHIRVTSIGWSTDEPAPDPTPTP